MLECRDTSYLLEEDIRPLQPNPGSLHERLQTQYINIPPEDQTFMANLIRLMAKITGRLFTPRQTLGILRVLRAFTFCFLVMTVLSDIMYMMFLEILASKTVRIMAGGSRDLIIRIYGLVLTIAALAIELEKNKFTRKMGFSGLRGFIPRSLLYFFVAIITGSHPVYRDNYFDSLTDDDLYQAAVGEIPNSAVGFQIVTSYVLAACSFVYFLCGALCFDRFTIQAFLNDKDPLVTTYIANGRTGTPPLSATSTSATGGGDYQPPMRVIGLAKNQPVSL